MLRRLLNRLRYTLERLFVQGPQYRVLAIAALIGLISVVGGALVMAAGGGFDFGEAVWWAFLRLSDPGYLGDDEGTWVRTVSTVLTVAGYVVFLGALVAVMTQWLQAKMRRLESGITPVARDDHVVVLGWTNRTGAVVRELLLSKERVRRFLRRHGAEELHIVVLAEEVDEALLQDLRDRVDEAWDERRVTLRSGSALRVEHLERVDYLNAAAILVPADEFEPGGADTVDAHTIKTLLSLNAGSGPGAEGQLPYAVGEVFDASKVPVARRAYRGPLEVLASDAAMTRLLAQNVRHPGLSHVYNEVLSLGTGSEFYVRSAEGAAGRRVQELAEEYRGAVLAGLLRTEDGGLQPWLNPPPDFEVSAGDRLVLLAPSYERAERVAAAGDGRELASSERRSSGDGAPGAPGEGAAGPDRSPPSGAPLSDRRVLLLGWSHKVPALLREFGSYADEAFTADVLSTLPVSDRRARMDQYGIDRERLTVRHVKSDYTLFDELREAEPGKYDSVVLMASDRVGSSEEADARTILGSLLLQELLGEEAGRPRVIIELQDPENVPLLDGRPGEVLITPVLTSHMLAQIALRRELRVVFEELFTAGGAEITFRRATDYGLTGPSVPFAAIARAAVEHGETALGVGTPGDEDGDVEGAGLRLGPGRDERFRLREETRLVVLQTY